MLLVSFLVIVLQPGFLLAVVQEGRQYVYHQTAACCAHRRSWSDLVLCINEMDYGTKDIAIISYASNDILDYAAYAFGVNSAFAEQNGFEMYFMNEAGGSNYEPRDARWNKIKILSEVLGTPEHDFEYVVWMDADLIVMDMDFDIRRIIAENSNSDIIISSERHAETGVANTGCFIMKNSAWSRDFLREWWESFDRSEAHDQVFFDRLYKSKLPDIKEHVAILPQDAINSTPPPMLYQTDSNQVLHMMGQPDDLRQDAFMSGFDEICHAYTEKRPLLHQLGLSRNVLSKKTEDYYVSQVREHYLVMTSKEFDLESFYNAASICLHDLIQLVDLDLGVVVSGDIARFNAVINDRIRILTSAATLDMKSIVAVYNVAVQFAELLFDVVADSPQKLEILHRVEVYLDTMLPLLHPSAKSIVYNMQIKHFTTRGAFMITLRECSLAREAYARAMGIFKEHEVEGGIEPQLQDTVQRGLQEMSTCVETSGNDARGAGVLLAQTVSGEGKIHRT